MQCVGCATEISLRLKNYLCFHCGEIACSKCGQEVFKNCPTCRTPRSKRATFNNLIEIIEKEPYHKNRVWIYYTIADNLKDKKLSYKWFLKAAHEGIPSAMDYIGYLYLKGLRGVVKKDYKKALQWLTLSAENGFKHSFFDLAFIYEKGLGVTPDPYRATTIYLVGGLKGCLKCRETTEKRALQLEGFKTAY